MGIKKIATHAKEIKERIIIPQLTNPINWNLLIDASSVDLDQVETICDGFLEAISLQKSEGAQLDKWGALVGLKRAGKSDEVLRRLAISRLTSARNTGDVETLIANIKLLFNEDIKKIELIEKFPTYIHVFLGYDILKDAGDIEALQALRLIKPAGVGLLITKFSTSVTNQPLRLQLGTAKNYSSAGLRVADSGGGVLGYNI